MGCVCEYARKVLGGCARVHVHVRVHACGVRVCAYVSACVYGKEH